MTKHISSPSANSITSEAEPEPTGQPVTDPSSENTSTIWTILMDESPSGKRDVVKATVRGGHGRISYSRGPRGGGEVRIYRNESTKVFDAAFSGVKHIFSDRVSVDIISVGNETTEKPMEDEVTLAFSPTGVFKVKWMDLDPFQQQNYISEADGDISLAERLYNER